MVHVQIDVRFGRLSTRMMMFSTVLFTACSLHVDGFCIDM